MLLKLVSPYKKKIDSRVSVGTLRTTESKRSFGILGVDCLELVVDGEERPEQGGREVIKIRFGGEFMNASGINPSHFCQLLVGQRGPPFTLAFCSLFPGFGATVPTALSEPLKELQPHPHPAPSG